MDANDAMQKESMIEPRDEFVFRISMVIKEQIIRLEVDWKRSIIKISH